MVSGRATVKKTADEMLHSESINQTLTKLRRKSEDINNHLQQVSKDITACCLHDSLRKNTVNGLNGTTLNLPIDSFRALIEKNASNLAKDTCAVSQGTAAINAELDNVRADLSAKSVELISFQTSIALQLRPAILTRTAVLTCKSSRLLLRCLLLWKSGPGRCRWHK
jgi:hypothetical protein